jgi:hypothetical protein
MLRGAHWLSMGRGLRRVVFVRGRTLKPIVFARRPGKQLRIDVVFQLLLRLLLSWRSVADSAVGKEARGASLRAG